MRTYYSFIFLLLLFFVRGEEVKEEVVKVSARDSYLEAYQDSHHEAIKVSKSKKLVNSPPPSSLTEKTDRDFTVDSSPSYHVYSAPNNNIDDYGAPKPQYGPPSPQYGPPSPQYGPPSPQYGSPTGSYGPPSYGPPAYESQYKPPGPVYGGPQSVQVFYGQQGMPHALLNFWEKLKFKLDLFTIGKILLKLVIFKKIVSLIAILCLLLFIPALKKKGGSFTSSDEGDEGIMRGSIDPLYEANERLNRMTAFVEKAIRKYAE